MTREPGTRIQPRVRTVSLPLTARVDDSGPFPVKNLSLGGVFVIARQRWEVGSKHSVRLAHQSRSISAVSRVTHLQADGAGFAFFKPDARIRAAVGALVDDLLSTATPLDDRRSHPRAKVDGVMMWTTTDQDAAAPANEGVLRDLSRSGALFQCESPPPGNSDVILYLPGFTYSGGGETPSELRGCTARVVRHTEDGIAVAFENPSAEFKMAVEHLLAQGAGS